MPKLERKPVITVKNSNASLADVLDQEWRPRDLLATSNSIFYAIERDNRIPRTALLDDIDERKRRKKRAISSTVLAATG
ncbi:MAG TPA: hypothetical protein DE036_08000 [Actinobacteria bacterium]|nr:hypothetical protein [Actinomycetota bacterium]